MSDTRLPKLAIITIGNTLRTDDGIAERICESLPENTFAQITKYDLGLFTNLLGEAIKGQDAAIIVDAVCSGKAEGTVTEINLNSVLSGSESISLRTCHGISILDELKLLQIQNEALPARFLLFGIEVQNTNWKDSISKTLEQVLPEIRAKLILSISRLLECG